MITTLKSIAEKRRLDAAEFTEFALLDPDKYGVWNNGQDYVTSRLYTDKLILDFFDYKLERENMKTLLMFKLELARKSTFT